MRELMARSHTLTRLTSRLAVRILIAALLCAIPFYAALAVSPAAPDLGTAGHFAALAPTVTCTTGPINGDVGLVAPNAWTACPVTGGAVYMDADTAFTDFQTAYSNLVPVPCDVTVNGSLAGQFLPPGVYCIDDSNKTGVLTLTNPLADPSPVWIFKTPTPTGHLAADSFQVVMADGSLPCATNARVFWWTADYAALTSCNFVGTILSGSYVAVTGGTFNGQAFAKTYVTVTSPGSFSTCGNPPVPPITTCDVWHWNQGNDLRGVAYNNSYNDIPTYVAVGRAGTVITSPDASTWTPKAPPVPTDLLGVCWDGTNHQFVAVGMGGVILTSPTGAAWTPSSTQGTRTLNSVAYANGYLVAVGDLGYALHSTDGQTWTDFSPPGVTANLNGVFGVLFLGNTYFQAAGDSAGGNAVALWTVNPFAAWNTLTPSPATGTYRFNGMLYTGGSAVGSSDWLMAGDNAMIYMQPSGSTTPAQQTVPGTGTGAFYGIAINGTTPTSLRVVVGAGGRIVTSPDEMNWTDQASTVTVALHAVIWDGSKFVAVGDAGVVVTSSDGATWARQTAGDINDLHGVAYSPTANAGGPRFVAVDGSSILISDDGGLTWAVQTYSDPQSVLGGVVWANGQFVAVGTGGVILTSPDGASWTHRDFGTGDLKAVAFGHGVYVAVGGGIVAPTIAPAETTLTPAPSLFYTTILTSPDGVTWTPATPPPDLVATPRILNGVACIAYPLPLGDFFIAVGDAKNATTGTFIWDNFTPTGTWADISNRYSNPPTGGGPFPTINNLYGVVAGGPDASNPTAQDYLLVGDNGALAYSWAGDSYLYPIISGTINRLNGALWDGCNYLVVGNAGTTLVSQNILSWARMLEPNTNILSAIAAGPSDYVSVGEGGTILHAARVVNNVVPPDPPATGVLNVPYAFNSAPTGGGGGYTFLWEFGDGGMATTQNASHAYTASGLYNWTLTVLDCSGLVGCASGTIVINNCPAITVAPATLPAPVVGIAYSQYVTASGGAAPYTFAVTTSALPPNLVLNPTTGQISGMPTAAGSFSFTITATDSNGCTGFLAYTMRTSAYDLSFRDDYGRSTLCVNSATGAYSFTKLLPLPVRMFTGVATVQTNTSLLLYISKVGFNVAYNKSLHMCTSAVISGTQAFSLLDRNTLDDPPVSCGGLAY